MKKITVSHFIPLIGAFEIARREMNNDGFDLSLDDIVSYSAFKVNESNMYYNYKDLENSSKYLIDDLICETNYETEMTKFKKFISDNKIKSSNLLLGVPPCSSLSQLNCCNDKNSPKARGADAVQANWMYGMIKYYLASDSDVLVFENAPNLIGPIGEKIINRIVNIIETNGYKRKVQLVKTSTMQHGIPQNRVRSFLFIHKNDKFIKLENKIHDKIKIEDFIKKNKSKNKNDIMNYTVEYKNVNEWLQFVNDNPEIINMVFKANSDKEEFAKTFVISLFDWFKDNIDKTKNYPKINKEINHAIKKRNMGMGFWDASPVLVKGKVNAIISKSLHRILDPTNGYKSYITMRDAMNLMGYPKDFNLANKKFTNHICQSVPICTAKDAIKWGIELLNVKKENIIEDEKLNEYKFIIQNNTKGNLEEKIQIIKNKKITDFK